MGSPSASASPPPSLTYDPISVQTSLRKPLGLDSTIQNSHHKGPRPTESPVCPRGLKAWIPPDTPTSTCSFPDHNVRRLPQHTQPPLEPPLPQSPLGSSTPAPPPPLHLLFSLQNQSSLPSGILSSPVQSGPYTSREPCPVPSLSGIPPTSQSEEQGSCPQIPECRRPSETRVY